MIFFERDTALSAEKIDEKIKVLREACDTGDDVIAKKALKRVIPTFKAPEEVNHVFDIKKRLEDRNGYKKEKNV